MNITTGTKFGRYEIRSLIGVGGMGEVYRATDPKIGRDVAINIRPAAVCSLLLPLTLVAHARASVLLVIPVPASDIKYLCPMMRMFPGIVYTGRDGLDVSGIHDRASLIAFLVAHPGMTFVHGMGVSVYDALAADVAKAAGSISMATAGGTPHFRMADIMGLSKGRAGGAVQGILLNVNPRTYFQPKAVFALK